MEPTNLPMEIIRILPKAAIAHKYNCSVQYVRKVLNGLSTSNTPRTRGIRRDALDISRILMRETDGQKFSWAGLDYEILNQES